MGGSRPLSAVAVTARVRVFAQLSAITPVLMTGLCSVRIMPEPG
jgi:hypothetical protein